MYSCKGNNLPSRPATWWKKKFREGDPKSAWQGMKTITGCRKRTNPVVPSGDIATFVGELNNFYARFDNNDFRGTNLELRET